MQQPTGQTVAKDHENLPSERRAGVRYTDGREGICRPALTSSAPGIPAWWADISTRGVGPIVEDHFEPRTLLLLELNDEADGTRQLRRARVRYVMTWGRKRWWLGCKLSSALTKEELEMLMAGGGTTD
jgi:hypothetical protein